jgi:tetratricopeptide (TPR) repeat protein
LSAQDGQIRQAYLALAGRLNGRPSASAQADIDEVLAFSRGALGSGQPALAIALLERVAGPNCQVAQAWQALGLAYRDTQDMERAVEALTRATHLDPQNPTTAFAYAQVLFETARPAVDAFARARALSPENPTLIRNSAAALAAEGMQEQAEAMLTSVLAREPLWLDGHKTLASLRVSGGNADLFDASFKAACASHPQNLGLRLAWIHLLSTARAWEQAHGGLHQALADFGSQRGLELARLHIASESGDVAGDDPALFDGVKDIRDPGLDLCRVRHALRLGDPSLAVAICEMYVSGPTAPLFWPYLSIAWRLIGNPRAAWLDGQAPPIGQFDLGLSATELADLTTCLQSLHTLQAPFLEQSVRGGTQTDRQLFFRPIPIIQKVRGRVQALVRTYIDQMGQADAGHPLLAPPRNESILFEGSWSVRLKSGGHHSAHTHPKGWISSALYVDVPPKDAIGAAPSGWISFGNSPPELKTGLQPYHQVKPDAGKLVLFPSTLWHHTIPFAQGERLTIAFDVKVPVVSLRP